MRTALLLEASALALALLFLAPIPMRVLADTCASSPVVARGEEARYVWLAKTKARANWRAKVRATPGLGPNFANWSRAQNTEERCLTGPAGSLCIFTGTPCAP
ncbi:hypothetical protein [Hyphomicrobium sp. 2TAF46]|uniref:hypothetical protein n=1 Tax=Hyphomicrobium sp. 2TAF46 TaxID=3233019 RepID=UPI003F90E0D5